MTDDLDRFAHEIIAAALRDDQEALKGNVQSLIVTYRQLRNELERERADATVLRQALIAWIDADETNRFADEDENLTDLARTLRDQPTHPGAALLAELDAARAVVDAARPGFGVEKDIERAYAFDPIMLTAAIRLYDDAARKQ